MAKPTTNDRQLQAEHLRQTVGTAGFEMFMARVAMMIEEERKSLEADKDAVDTARIRGKIAALRTVLDLPKIMKTELSM